MQVGNYPVNIGESKRKIVKSNNWSSRYRTLTLDMSRVYVTPFIVLTHKIV